MSNLKHYTQASLKLKRRTVLLAAGSTFITGCLPFIQEGQTPLDYTFPDSLSDSGLLLPPTPACDDAHATASVTEGPFYTTRTPQRNSLLEPGIQGTPLKIIGRVLDTRCQPLAGVAIDFWQANTSGNYDNDGFTLRGHQFTDEKGIFWLETIKPAPYDVEGTWRTPHIHVKMQGENTPLLTTQLFFPDEAENNRKDGLYRDDLVMKLETHKDASLTGQYEFILKV